MRLSILSSLCTASILILSGCTPSTLKPKEVLKIDTTLQKIELTQNGVYADMKAIAFEYKPITDARVKGVYVYRMTGDNDGSEYYDTIDNRFATHYVDSDIEPARNYRYYFKTFSDSGESEASEIISVNSLAPMESVTWIHSINGMPRSAKIIWRPHSDQKVISYIIERKTLEKDEWKEIAVVKGRLSAEFIDTELKDNYIYTYRIRVKTFNDIISNPSQEVRVVTKPLPAGVENLTASNNLPKTIELNWSPSSYEHFAAYNVYRSATHNGDLELISKVQTNHFIDKIDEDGKQYFYKVSVVDNDGLESEHENYSIQGSTLAIPQSPYVTKASYRDGKIELTWNTQDSRVRKFHVIRTYKKGWLDTFKDEYEGITQTMMIDSNVEQGVAYHYQVIAIDEYGLKSKPSLDAEVRVPVALEGIEEIQTPVGEVKQNSTLEVSKPASRPEIGGQKIENQDIITPIENLDLSEI